MNNTAKDLQAIYRERVLEHSRNPHNFGPPAAPDREALGFNPLCGDKLTVYLNLQDDVISGVTFEGIGCAISIASASMMTDALCGQSLTEADALINAVERMFTENAPIDNERLSEVMALEGVRSFPSRIKCATLAWTALAAALRGPAAQVTTE